MTDSAREGGKVRRAWSALIALAIGGTATLLAAAIFGLLCYVAWPTYQNSAGERSDPVAIARAFLANRGAYIPGQQNHPLYALAEAVKAAVPPGSRVYVSGGTSAQTRMRYYLKPELTFMATPEEWDYYLDWDNSMDPPAPGASWVPLCTESNSPPVRLYAAPGRSFADGTSPESNGSVVEGVDGTALALDGVDDAVVVPAGELGGVFEAAEDFSVAFWWQSAAGPFPDGYRPALSNYHTDHGGLILFQRGDVAAGRDRIYMNFYIAGEGAPVMGPAIDMGGETGTWHHYVFRRQGATLQAWRNGQLLATRSAPTFAGPMGAGVDLRIGAPGAIDELRVYGRALDESEIAALSASAAAPAEAGNNPDLPAPVLHLAFDDLPAPGVGAAPESAASHPKSMPDDTRRSLLWFAVLQGMNLVGGCFLLLALRGQSFGTLHGHLYSWAMAYLLGFIWNNTLLMALAMGGAPLNRLIVAGCYLSLPVLFVFFVRRGDLRAMALPPLGRWRTLSRVELSLAATLAALALAMFFWVATSSVLEPRYRWDAVSHWLPKARMIYGLGGFDFSETHHNEYPILWPLAIAAHFFFTGYHADYIAYWLSALFLAALLVLLYHGARLAQLGPAAGLGAIAGFFFFFYDDFLLAAYAEGLFTLLFGACVVFLLDRLVPGTPHFRDYLLAALLLLGLTLAKFEGHLAVLILGIAWALVMPIAGRSFRHYLYWIPAIGICMAPQFGWIAWQRHREYLSGFTTQLGAGPPDAERIRVWLDGILRSVMQIEAQQLVLFSAMVLLLACTYGLLRRRLDFQTVFLAVAGMLAFSYVSLLGWKTETIPSGFTTVVPRLYLHFTPALFLLCAIIVAEAGKGTILARPGESFQVTRDDGAESGS